MELIKIKELLYRPELPPAFYVLYYWFLHRLQLLSGLHGLPDPERNANHALRYKVWSNMYGAACEDGAFPSRTFGQVFSPSRKYCGKSCVHPLCLPVMGFQASHPCDIA